MTAPLWVALVVGAVLVAGSAAAVRSRRRDDGTRLTAAEWLLCGWLWARELTALVREIWLHSATAHAQNVRENQPCW